VKRVRSPLIQTQTILLCCRLSTEPRDAYACRRIDTAALVAVRAIVPTLAPIRPARCDGRAITARTGKVLSHQEASMRSFCFFNVFRRIACWPESLRFLPRRICRSRRAHTTGCVPLQYRRCPAACRASARSTRPRSELSSGFQPQGSSGPPIATPVDQLALDKDSICRLASSRSLVERSIPAGAPGDGLPQPFSIALRLSAASMPHRKDCNREREGSHQGVTSAERLGTSMTARSTSSRSTSVPLRQRRRQAGQPGTPGSSPSVWSRHRACTTVNYVRL